MDTTIGKEADIQLLRDFLSGDYCIHGVIDKRSFLKFNFKGKQNKLEKYKVLMNQQFV